MFRETPVNLNCTKPETPLNRTTVIPESLSIANSSLTSNPFNLESLYTGNPSQQDTLMVARACCLGCLAVFQSRLQNKERINVLFAMI